MITVGLGNESGWAKKINYKYIKKQKNKMKKKKANFLSHSGPLAGFLFYCLLI